MSPSGASSSRVEGPCREVGVREVGRVLEEIVYDLPRVSICAVRLFFSCPRLEAYNEQFYSVIVSEDRDRTSIIKMRRVGSKNCIPGINK